MSSNVEISDLLQKNKVVVVTLDSSKYLKLLENDTFIFEECLRLLPLENKVRHKKFLNDQITSLGNSLLQLWGCRLAISVHDRFNTELINPKDIIFSRGEFGKPYLADYHPHITFSMTNGDMISSMVITCGLSTDVGIDLASIEDYQDNQYELFKDILTSKEMDCLKEQSSFSAYQKRKFFARVWSIKESYTKYTGIGLNCDLSKITVNDINPLEKTMKRSSSIENNVEMEFVSDWIDEKTVLTVCYPSQALVENNDLEFLNLDLLDLSKSLGACI